MNLRIFSFALILIALAIRPAQALDSSQTDLLVGQGINAVRQIDGRILVQTQQNKWYKIDFSNDRLTLSESSPPQQQALTDPERLPDTATAFGRKNIRRAWFARPTRRYNHGVLGDAIEAGSIKVETANGDVLEMRLPDTAVFEDRTPRLADVNGDGNDEIIAVKSDLQRGAAVTLVGFTNGRLNLLAEAPAIGLSHRWLNPVGAADFDGDGKIEIAVVITPHIGGTLRLYEWRGKSLVADHSAFGFSNHAMGSRELGLSAIVDVDGDGIMDVVVPDAGRKALVATAFTEPTPRTLNRSEISGPFSSGLFVVDLNKDGVSEVLFATAGKTLTLVQWHR